MTDRPFAEVLDQALRERGLALERVVDHLERRGVSCSISTLSLWRRGRTRPSLARSGAVLHTLESVLDLERDVLVDALAVPRPGEPGWWDVPTPIGQLADAHRAYAAFREAMGVGLPDAFDRLHVHVVIDVDEDRTVCRVSAGQVLRAREDGADTLTAFYWTDDLTPDGQPVLYELTELVGARVEQQMELSEAGATAALLRLDDPLQEGEVTVVDVRLTRLTEGHAVREGWDFEELQMQWPVERMALEVRFLGELPEEVCGRVASRLPAGALLRSVPSRELVIGPTVQLSAADVSGGGVRVDWRWAGMP